jgi:DNA replication protein DnaC
LATVIVPVDSGRLGPELARLRRYLLLVFDEVGYLPFEQEAANLMTFSPQHISVIERISNPHVAIIAGGRC